MCSTFGIFALFFAVVSEPCLADSNSTDVLAKLKSLNKKVTNVVEDVVKRILPRILESSYEAEVSSRCMGSFLKLLNGLRGTKLWAISMLDASGKISPGFLGGTVTDLGDYDLCLEVDDSDPSFQRPATFRGQYCTVLVSTPTPSPPPRHISINTDLVEVQELAKEDELFYLIGKRLAMLYRVPIRMGLCVPSTCSRTDLEEIAKSALNSLSIDELEVEIPRCEVRAPYQISLAQIVVLYRIRKKNVFRSLWGFLFALTFVSTVVERCLKSKINCPGYVRHFEHFSLWSNAGKFFCEESTSRSASRLDVLDGIRWWSLVWTVLSHTYGLFSLAALGRFVNVLEMIKTYSFNFIMNAWVSVDSFFLLGGILVAHSILGELGRNKGQLNFVKYIFRRFLRLTPALSTCVALVFLLPWFGSGPLWEEVVTKQVRLCQRNWWLAIIYANSWLGHDDACLVSTWYVSADMHLYIVSPIFVYLYYKNNKLGVLACLVAISAASAAIFILNFRYDLYPLPMALTFNEVSTEEVFTTVYFRPYSHLAPYLIGILLGCFLKTNDKLTMKWWMSLGGWCLSAFLALSVILCPKPWHQGFFPSTAVSSLYQALHRPAFALSVAWVVAACRYGYGGIVTNLLGWRGYKRWSQLVYLLYLVQLPVLWVRIGNFRRTMPFDHYNFVVEAMGILVVSAILALTIHLLVEAPFVSLDAACFPRFNKEVKGQNALNGEAFPPEPKKEVELGGAKRKVESVRL